MSQPGMWKALAIGIALLTLQALSNAEATPTTTIVAQNSNKCLNVRGTPQATDDGVLIEQYSCTGSSNQTWELRDAGTQQYQLVASNSYKCADVVSGANQDSDGAGIEQATCDTQSRQPRQYWRLIYLSDNVYRIVNAANGLCLDVTGGPQATGDEALIELWHCTGASNQSWGLTPAHIEARPVVAKNSGKCLDVTGGPQATQDGALLEQYTCTGAANQEWTPRSVVGGIELVAKNSGKCIEAIDGGTANGTNLRQASCTGAAPQLWTQQSAGGVGEYKFVHVASGRCLDVTGGPGATSNGALLELWTCTGSTNQTWTLGAPGVPSAGTRDPLKWPFSQYSIWNMPIGSGAIYVPANLPAAPDDPYDVDRNGNPIDSGWTPMPGVDLERIVLRPSAPMTQIVHSKAGWQGGSHSRCYTASDTDKVTMNGLPISVPIPTDYVQPSDNGNDGATFLMPDGRTLLQSQPFARCNPGEPATSALSFAAEDLYGEGRTGAHGGSKLSSFGGSLRLGELRPGQQGPRHALKINLFEQMFYYNCSLKSECYRWPASSADSNALDAYGIYNNNQNRAMRMGALLAIPASVDINAIGLESDPGRQIAWTLQNYGAYIVDSYSGSVVGLSVEEGVDVAVLSDGQTGRKLEQFADDYKNVWKDKNGRTRLDARIHDDTPWTRDWQRILPLLAVVDNNSPTSIGGGGTPRQPIAPVFQ